MILASCAAPLVALIEGRGMDSDALMHHVGLRRAMLASPQSRLSFRQVNRMAERAIQVSGDAALGMHHALGYKPSLLGPLGLLIRDLPRPRDALMLLVRDAAFHGSFMSIDMEDADGYTTIRTWFHHVVTSAEDGLRCSAEILVGLQVEVLKRLMWPDWRPVQVSFQHSEPDDTRLHRQVLGNNLVFDALFNGFVVRSRDIDLPCEGADTGMARYARALIDENGALLGGGYDDGEFEMFRRAVVSLLPQGHAHMRHVAGHLGVTPRTLQRRLSNAGFSLTELIQTVRVEMAQHYVRQSPRPLGEVAVMLGFGSPSAFSRWHQLSFGSSPSASRAARQR